MKTCKSCYSGIPAGAEFCPGCGTVAPRGFLAALGALFSKPKAPPVQGSPSRPSANGAFEFVIQDAFKISGRGTVVTGHVKRGKIEVGDEVRFSSAKGHEIKCRVTGVELLGKITTEANEGDHAGLLLSGKTAPEEIAVGTRVEKI